MSGLTKLDTDMRGLPIALRRTPPIKLTIHGAVYRWVSRMVRNKHVLDLGCAEGLGTELLAQAAREVVAVDWDAQLIEIARASRPGGNIRYLVGDCLQPMFCRWVFDIIVNIAMLEHVEKPDVLVANAARYLRSDGVMLCATKNSEFCLKQEDGSPLYGNHAFEFSEVALRELLRTHFQHVETFALVPSEDARRFLDNRAALRMERTLVRLGVKELIPRGLRLRVREVLTGESVARLSPASFDVVPTHSEGSASGHYLLAIARRPRPEE